MKLLLFISFFFITSILKSQTYYVGNDSISFLMNTIERGKEIIEFKFKIFNKTSSSIYFGNNKFYNELAFFNLVGKTLFISCGGTYPFAYDRIENNDTINLMKINSTDSLIFIIKSQNFHLNSFRKLSCYDFNLLKKVFIFDYIFPNKIFTNQKFINYDIFLRLKSRLTFSIPGSICGYSAHTAPSRLH